MVLDIIKYGDADYVKLRLKNIDVKKENPLLQQLINDMFETLEYSKSGVGLAAPQIGRNLNLFVIKTPTYNEVFINPEVRLEGLDIQNKESCLSFPSMSFPVNRKKKVKIKYFNRNWVLLFKEFDDELSIIIQHEFDHLRGRLIID
jgi:peptide deformylase